MIGSMSSSHSLVTKIRWVRPSSWLGPTTPSLAFSVMMAAHVSSEIYVPIGTARLLSGGTSDVRQIMFTLDEERQSQSDLVDAAVRKAAANPSRPMTAPHFASETIWKNTSASRASSQGSASLFGWLASAPLQPVSWASVISCDLGQRAHQGNRST